LILQAKEEAVNADGMPIDYEGLSRKDLLQRAASAGIGIGVVGALVAPGAYAGSTMASRLTAAASGGTITYGASHDFDSIDPAIGYTLWSRYIQDNSYDALFRYTGSPPRLVKHLASDYSVSKNGLVWTFRLQPGVKFHDGRPLTSQDVRYSIERVLAINNAPAFLWQGVIDPKRIKTPNNSTVVITLKHQFAPFLHTLPWLYIVNRVLLSEHATKGDWGQKYLQTHDAGSGPFYLSSYLPGTQAVSKKFPRYWKAKKAQLDGWTYAIHSETSTLKQLLKNKQIQMTDQLGQDDYKIVSGYSNVDVVDKLSLTPAMVKMNNQKAPTNNLNFRKAVSYAFDYDGAIAGPLSGYGTRLDSPLPRGFPGHVSASPYMTDVDKAKSYLQKSGFDTSQTLLYNYVSGSPVQQDFGLLLQESLGKIGVKVDVEGLTEAPILAGYKKWQTTSHFNWIWASTDYPDPDIIFYPQYQSNNWGSWYSCSFYKNPVVDRLILKARSTLDSARRLSMYRQIQKIIVADAADVWVYQQHFLMALNDDVKGYAYQPAGLNSTYFYPMSV
jgi:peptide/nickel transport system substrate-binding protein